MQTLIGQFTEETMLNEVRIAGSSPKVSAQLLVGE